MDSRVLGDPGTAAFRVDRYPFYLLNRLVGRYNAMIAARLRAIALDIPFWRVLMILGERDGRGVADIAEAAVIPLSTMTRVAQRMAASGYVDVGASEMDARVSHVTLTDAGRTKLAEARAATSPVYGQIIRNMTLRDFDTLVVLLNRLHDNLVDPG